MRVSVRIRISVRVSRTLRDPAPTRFGTTADEDLVDPSFPRRFVPRAFDAILRNKAHELLPTFTATAQAWLGVRVGLGSEPSPPQCRPGEGQGSGEGWLGRSNPNPNP